MLINSHYSGVDYDGRYEDADMMHTESKQQEQPTSHYNAKHHQQHQTIIPRKPLKVAIEEKQQHHHYDDTHSSSGGFSAYSSTSSEQSEVHSGNSDSSMVQSMPIRHVQLSINTQAPVVAAVVIPVKPLRKRPTPRKFKFDTADFLKSAAAAATIRNIPHWTHFPEPKDFKLCDRYTIKQVIHKKSAAYVEQQLQELALQQQQKQNIIKQQQLQQQQQQQMPGMYRQASLDVQGSQNPADEQFTLRMPNLQSRKYDATNTNEEQQRQQQLTDRFNSLHAHHSRHATAPISQAAMSQLHQNAAYQSVIVAATPQQTIPNATKQLTTPSLPHINAAHISTQSVSVPASPVTQPKQLSQLPQPTVLYSTGRRLVVQNTVPVGNGMMSGTVSAPVSPSAKDATKSLKPTPPPKPSASAKQAAVYRYTTAPGMPTTNDGTGSYNAKTLDNSASFAAQHPAVHTQQHNITLTGSKLLPSINAAKSQPTSPMQGHKRSRSMQRVVAVPGNMVHVDFNSTAKQHHTHSHDMTIDSFSNLHLVKKQHDLGDHHSHSETNIHSTSSRPSTPTSSLSKFLNRIKSSLMDGGNVTKRATVR